MFGERERRSVCKQYLAVIDRQCSAMAHVLAGTGFCSEHHVERVYFDLQPNMFSL